MSETRSVVVGSTRFLLREAGSGDGTPVLLLHGVPETSTAWRFQLPRLAHGRRVLAPDLPGLGGSAYSGPYDVASLVEQLVALLDEELPGQQVDVVGHDWGGSLALALAGTHPTRVRRLAVSNTVYRSVPLHRTLYMPFLALPLAPELLFRVCGTRVVEQVMRALWKSSTPLEPEVLAEYAAAYGDPVRAAAMLGYYRAAVRPQVRSVLTERKVRSGLPRVDVERALVFWGARDEVLPISTGETIVRDLGPSCTMTTVPGAGHFVMEEAPDVVSDLLEEFLRDDAPAATAPRARRRTSATA